MPTLRVDRLALRAVPLGNARRRGRRPGRRAGIAAAGLVLFLMAVWPGTGGGSEPPAEVLLIRVADAVSPGTADFIHQGIRRAETGGSALVVIELDTPGGLAESMRTIVQDLLATRVPVAVFVSPGGARAASAGVMITLAADIAAMAPGTHIGAAHPVGAGGQEIEGKMSDKVVNDMVAHARSVAERRGRNAAWVEKAVRESVSATETEALREKIVDLVAADVDDLLRQLNGRALPGKGTLKLENARKVAFEEGLRTRILKTISNPNIAYILMMIGLAGIYFELAHPGAIFPGVVGGICLVLAFFALQTLPVNYAGVLLIGLAIIFFILELKVTSYGLLSLAGIASLLLGSLMLFQGQEPQARIAWGVLIPTLAAVSGFFVAIALIVFRSQLRRPLSGSAGMVGEIGVVRQSLSPQGKVFVHGELWNAVAQSPLAENTRVRVVAVEGLTLKVEPVQPERPLR
jgi:membrane-bound serine protease (ClpP class)